MTVQLADYEHGRLLYLPNDIYAGRFIRDHGQYSPGEVELFGKILRQADVAIEVGAHIGALTIPMARMVAPMGSVLAFEPQPHIYNVLCGNIALNGLTSTVAPMCMAAGAEQGSVTVPPVDYDAENNFGGCTFAIPRDQGRQIQMIALDQVTHQLGALRLLKVDAEGMERDVLVGAEQLIRRTRPYLYFEDDREESSVALRSFAKFLGYRLYLHKPLYVTRDDRPADLAGLVSTNVLGVPVEWPIRVELEEL